MLARWGSACSKSSLASSRRPWRRRSSASRTTPSTACAGRVASSCSVASASECEPFEGQSDRLDLDVAELAADPHRVRAQPAPGGGIALQLERDCAVVEREPAVLDAERKAFQQPAGASEPSVRDGELSAELEMVDGGPHRHAAGRGTVAPPPEERVRPLASLERRSRVVLVPRRPAQTLVPLRSRLALDRLPECRLRLTKRAAADRVPSGEDRIR